MRAGFITVDGTRIRYLAEGRGPALLLLHGVGLSADIFVRNLTALGERGTALALDLPGHGFSDTLAFDGVAPQRAMARCVLRTADALGIDRFCVLGHSFGGLVGALIHFERPGRLDGLIIVASGSTFHPAAEQVRTLRAAAENGSRAMTGPTLESCRQRLANICYDPAAVADEILLCQLTAYALPDRLTAYRATIEGAIDSLEPDCDRVLDRLEQLDVPTLIISGRDDIRAAVTAHENGCRRLPDAELAVFDRCGHLPFMEHPALFNDTVCGFLARVSADRSRLAEAT